MALFESQSPITKRSQQTLHNNNNDHNNNSNNSNNQIACDNSYVMTVTTSNESFANVGGPTQTTPTLTPTTLRNIEESFMETIPRQPVTHQHMAGFVPPLVNISSTYTSIQSSLNNNNRNNNSSNNSNSNSDLDYGSDEETDDSSSQSQWNAVIDNCMSGSACDGKPSKMNGIKKRATSGRKPMRNDKLTPEEERKREQRRERNKQAAARCRKRRMDHTNSLLRETDGLEEKRQSLHNEIELLKSQKEELEFLLEAHKANCKRSAKAEQIDIKPMVNNGNIIILNGNVKSRPNSLPISCVYGQTLSEMGIPIQTPSTGLFLESMEGTGLTPLLNSSLTPSTISSATCGAQQRSSTTPNGDNSDTVKLVPL